MASAGELASSNVKFTLASTDNFGETPNPLYKLNEEPCARPSSDDNDSMFNDIQSKTCGRKQMAKLSLPLVETDVKIRGVRQLGARTRRNTNMVDWEKDASPISS